MAFTVTVIERVELEAVAAAACDNCDTGGCGSCAVGADAQTDDATTALLSPLES